MKHIIALFVGIILGISSVSLVFGGLITNLQSITPDFVLSKNIFPDSKELNSTILGFKHEGDISDFTFHSSCKVATKFLGKENFTSYFKLTFFDVNCQNPYVSLEKNGKIIEKSTIKLEILGEKSFYNVFLDLNDEQLQNILSDLASENFEESTGSIDEAVIQKNISSIKQKRKIQELKYKETFIKHLLQKRQEKYSIPVAGYTLPTEESKMPNAGRPYRKGYTDGIHHSWDIDAKTGTPVVALDDAFIVRVVDNWSRGSLSNLRKGTALTAEDLERNLDILRGNQVWIKTMKGDVVMYNHLETITSNLKEGQFIARGTTLGTIGVSGVPEVGYNDSHLDFSIMKNPYNTAKAGSYETEEYMFWSWKMKGKSREYVLEHQYDLFEK